MAAIGQRLIDAYCAGFIDADGCVRFYSGSVRIEVTGVFPYVLQYLKDQYRGNVRKLKGPDRATYRWDVCGYNAQAALTRMIPFLFIKREQAVLALHAASLKPSPKRDGVEAQIRALKHHDYKL